MPAPITPGKVVIEETQLDPVDRDSGTWNDCPGGQTIKNLKGKTSKENSGPGVGQLGDCVGQR